MEKDTVWKVMQKHEDFVLIGGALAGIGVDTASDAATAGILEEAAKDDNLAWAKLDLARLKNAMAIPKAEGQAGGYIRAASLSTSMFVVRLRSGGLLLYSPVHVHLGSTLANLLAKLGPVEWLVLASSAHTLQVSEASRVLVEG